MIAATSAGAAMWNVRWIFRMCRNGFETWNVSSAWNVWTPARGMVLSNLDSVRQLKGGTHERESDHPPLRVLLIGTNVMAIAT